MAWGQASLDPYGGFTGLKGSNESGFFRVERLGDRLFLVTPDNHAFLSAAVTTALFNDRWGGYCPPLESYPTPYGNQAKYDGDRNAWCESLKSNLTRWGFNGLGCWCDPNVEGLTENVSCLFITSHAYRRGVARIGRDFPDVFDPRFAEAAEDRAKSLARFSDSRYRIGAFPDNELGWVGADYWGNQNGPTLPDGFIALDAGVPGKRHWADVFLRNKYGTITKLNGAYGTSFEDFTGEGSTLINVDTLANSSEHPAIARDKADFTEAVADQYYRVVSSAMRRHDPNHLVFSARWALWTTAFHVNFKEHQTYNERIWKAAGRYCDIIAINSYMDNGQLEEQHKLYSRVFAQTGKPFMITEWAAFADDTQFSQRKEWKRFQHQRGDFYFEQFKTLLDFKFADSDGRPVHACLGAQWFQYYDEPSLGRADGEKNNYGLLNVKDEPYLTALDVMGTFNRQMYDYVVNGSEPKLLAAPIPRAPRGAVSATAPVDLQRVVRVVAAPRFEWELPEGGASATLLYSPEKCFPQQQTIRVDGLESTHFSPREPLASGLWYWCVRAVDASGLGGRYSDPVAFYVEVAGEDDPPDGSIRFEDLPRWRNVSLEDGGWDGVTWAFADPQEQRGTTCPVRVQFTVNSINKQTGQQNERKSEIVWQYVGPPANLPAATHVCFDVKPNRAVDMKGRSTVASEFLWVRLIDGAGKIVLDRQIDPGGELPPLKWSQRRFDLAALRDPAIASVQFYIPASDESVPWDQRLQVWMDNLHLANTDNMKP